MMTDFKIKPPDQAALDPTKRVKYSLGMVLGVDEFEQNLTYLMARDNLHNRALHGYGTVFGLQVLERLQDQAPSPPVSPPQVLVKPGMAVDPKGRMICVPKAQCADVNNWLQEHEAEIQAHLGSPLAGQALDLYVVLCYSECETDATFVPGGPCRSQEDVLLPSRIADSFKLELTLTRPAQLEEKTVQRFGALLQRMRIANQPGPFPDAPTLADLVRALAEAEDGDLTSPPISSPPAADEVIYLRPDEAEALLEMMFRVWVTEVRPHLLAGCGGDISPCGNGRTPEDDPCVLLGKVSFDLASDGSLRVNEILGAENNLVIDEAQRPILLHTRLLQESILFGNRFGEIQHTFATLSLIRPATIRTWIHFGPLLNIDPAAILVQDAGENNVPVQALSQVGSTNVFDIDLVSPVLLDDGPWSVSFDASQIAVAASPTQTLRTAIDDHEMVFADREGDWLHAYLAVDRFELEDLENVTIPSPSAEGVLTWDPAAGTWSPQPLPAIPALINDLDDVDTTPADGQVLTWNQTAAVWQSADLPVLEDELVRIVALSWPHNGETNLEFQMSVGMPPRQVVVHGLVVAFGLNQVGDEGRVRARTLTDETFQVFVEIPQTVEISTVSPPSTVSLLNCMRLPGRVQPVMIDQIDPTGLTSVNATLPLIGVNGVAIILEAELLNDLVAGGIEHLKILIKGDFILDVDGRAIDAQHTRGSLPTGLHPENEMLGIQGGSFESWVNFDLGLQRGLLDINRATLADLVHLPNIGNVRAEEIIRTRDNLGGFTAVDDLETVSGIGRTLLDEIRPLITIRPPGR